MPIAIPTPRLPNGPRQSCVWPAPAGSSRALLLAAAAHAHRGPVVMVTVDAQDADALEEELPFFAGELPVLAFPDWETLPYDVFSPHPELVSQRIATLHRLPALRRGVLLVPVTALMQRIAPRTHIEETALVLRQGAAIAMSELKRQLETAGYRRVSQVAEPGDFARRGALLDVFPTDAAQPYRIAIDSDSDTLTSIRTVDRDTQRSQHPVAFMVLLPAREFPLTKAAAQTFRARLRERFPIDTDTCALYRDMREGTAPSGIECYLPLFFEHTATLFDYLADHALVVLDDGAREAAQQFWADATERHERRANDARRPALAPEELYLAPKQFEWQLENLARVEIAALAQPDVLSTVAAPAPTLTLDPRTAPSGTPLEQFLAHFHGPALIAADSIGRHAALIEILRDRGQRPTEVDGWASFLALDPDRSDGQALAIAVAPLEAGFLLADPALAVLTERELNGARVRSERRRPRHRARELQPDAHDLTGLNPGDPVVHVDNGVGRYQGLMSMELGGMPGEFLALEYAKGDKLYVPVSRLGQVSRYACSSAERAPLHALGNGSWERARAKAIEKVHDAAAELLALQAQREARGGTALTLDRRQLAAFGARFPFEETPDQLQAIDAVLRDLTAPRSMDRVICGDVGFGKTEVALRAAFAVASAGKQVAVLVPTTLLAQQHYRTFAERFADWPVRVGVLSRFRSGKKLTRTLEQLANGEIDVIVGTHKLLQPDVHFKDLALVIVDEEQRFGVRQKEQLKKLRAEVDLLTMTATPIPRTLNMALAGLRDLSLIATPPVRRGAVRTSISRWEPATIREALRRELARGGQVYFLHNEVESIERVAEQLRALVPGARIGVAHGQMAEGELERVMADFLRRRCNVLVCTTIIENGIDIPNANTIVINRAENFGLAQLQQLRGRVGRSNRRAYAYLIVADPAAMTAEAEQRLEAFAEVDELGAGFALAAHDLEIRGAGELLGHEQSGQIQEIGLDLYSDLLQRTMHALVAGDEAVLTLGATAEVDIELHLPALIPADYVADVPTRLALYKRIAAAPDEDTLRDLQVELIDRFGLLPQPVWQLCAIAGLRLMARPLGIQKVDLGHDGGAMVFDPSTSLAAAIDRLVESQPDNYARDGEDALRVTLDLADAADVIRAAQEILVLLGARRPE